MKKILALSAVAFLLFCNQAPAPVAEETRNPQWAEPMEAAGLPNLHRIDDGLYRGAQPEEEGFPSLAELGIKTVINLRARHESREEAEAAGLEYVALPMRAHRAKQKHVIEFLKVAADPERRPVFFHCMHGADRTGLMAAGYRVAVQEWTPEDAVEEMKEGGFGFHSIWVNLPDLVEEMDYDRVKKEAGIDTPVKE